MCLSGGVMMMQGVITQELHSRELSLVELRSHVLNCKELLQGTSYMERALNYLVHV